MNKLILSAILVILFSTEFTHGQNGLPGSWKYVSPTGEMIIQISTDNIVINSQTFPYKAEGNILMINEGTALTPYPYIIDGNKLTLEFPGGTEIIFTRILVIQSEKGQLPQSMSNPSAGNNHKQPASNLSGKWLFQNEQGQLILEFISSNMLSFNGENTQYQLKEGIIQAMGDFGWTDYPYTLDQGTLNITFPDGTRIPFTKTSSVSNQQEINQPSSGAVLTWQLKGALCSWSGSSNTSSSYSSTRKIVFDGQGNFSFGSESSFSSDAGIAYGGNPNTSSGKYKVGERTVTLYYQDGNISEFLINMRQDNGMITELMNKGTLYAKALCE
jgi:hypothetical protein